MTEKSGARARRWRDWRPHRPERWQDWHLKPDPLGYPRHGLVVFLLGLTILSGFRLLIGEPAADSVESTLPGWLVAIWALMISLGAGASLSGIYWQGDIRTGLVTKRFGYVCLAVASFIYALIVSGKFGAGGMLFGGILFGFAGACAHTAWRVNKRILHIVEESKAQAEQAGTTEAEGP